MSSSAACSDGVVDAAQMRAAMVDKLVAAKTVRSAGIEAAFRAVPRHAMVAEHPIDAAYRDCALPTKVSGGGEWLSSASQPSMVAVMLEQLDAQRGQRVLEVGAGVGYNAALLAEIVGDGGEVTTIEVDEEMAGRARRNLDSIGLGRVRVLLADGAFGCAEHGPYDRIILTAAAGDIAPAWREQLAPGARLVMPLSVGALDLSITFEQEDGCLVSRQVLPCSFMRMRGSAAGKPGLLMIGPEPPVEFRAADVSSVKPDELIASLSAAGTCSMTGIEIVATDAWPHLSLWLMLHDEQACDLRASGAAAERGLVPYLIGLAGKALGTMGLFEGGSLALLTRAPGLSPPAEAPKELKPFELFIRCYGQGAGDGLARRLENHVVRWHAAGRPRMQRLRIRVYAKDQASQGAPAALIRDEPSTRFTFDFAPE